MKKIIISLLLVFLSFGLFSETGYNGFQWGAEKKDVVIPNNPEYAYNVFHGPWKDEDFAIADTVNYSSLLFGGGTVFYHFNKNFGIRDDKKPGLYAVSSTISGDEIDYYKKKFDDKKIFELNCESSQNILTYEEKHSEGAFYDYYVNHALAILGVTSYYNIAKEYGKNWQGQGHITVYDYNDDSVICILENLVPYSSILLLIEKKFVL